MKRRSPRVGILGLALTAFAGMMACSSPDLSGPTTENPDDLPWTMELSAHAITLDTLAPYDTLQLTAVARNLAGGQLPPTATIVFTSKDSAVRVSATGLLQARKITAGAKIFASTIYRGIRITDSAIVKVTGIPNPGTQAIATLQISPSGGPGDTTIAAPNSQPILGLATKSMQISARNASNSPIANALVSVRSSDMLQGGFGSNFSQDVTSAATTTTSGSVTVQVAQTSHIDQSFTLYATATIYGATARDSIRITVTPPLLIFYSVTKSTPTGSTTPVYTLQPHPTITISAGGIVFWGNNTASPADSMDVVFDDSAAATADPYLFDNGGGNIAPFPGGDFANDPDFTAFSRTRQFLQPGTIHWTSPRMGVSGTIIVQ